MSDDTETEHLSRELTNLSTTSEASSVYSSTTAGTTGSQDRKENIDYSDQFDGQSDADKGLSRDNTVISKNSLSDAISVTRDSTFENTNSLDDNDNQNNQNDRESESKNDYSRESTFNTSTDEMQYNYNNANDVNYDDDDFHESSSRENSMSTCEDTMSTRENTMLTPEYTMSTRENTMSSRENTMSTRENTITSTENNEIEDHHEPRIGNKLTLEKEDSVLIEKDGKFELVDPDELEAGERQMLGLPPKNNEPSKKPSSAKAPNSLKILPPARPVQSSMGNPEYSHLQSAYAMSEQQKEMKKRRISVMQMRKQEEKERMKEEEEEQRKAAEKSFKKWISEKGERSKEHQHLQNAAEDKTVSEERRKAAEKAYNAWLKEKEIAMKEEKKMEKLRITEEAQAYVVRDRRMCDKAFREWIRKKKIEREQKAASERPIRKKSARTNKKKSAVVKQVYQTEESPKERRPTSSSVRLSSTYGYRHPASIDDFVARKW